MNKRRFGKNGFMINAAELAPLDDLVHDRLRDFYAAHVADHIRGAY